MGVSRVLSRIALKADARVYCIADDATAPVPVLGRWAASATYILTVTIIVAGIAAEPVLESLRGAWLLPR